MGEAKRRGTRERRVEEGIEKSRVDLEASQAQQAERLKRYRSDPKMSAVIRQTILCAGLSLFSGPVIKTKRWLK